MIKNRYRYLEKNILTEKYLDNQISHKIIFNHVSKEHLNKINIA